MKKLYITLVIAIFAIMGTAASQAADSSDDLARDAVEINAILSNWFVQTGFDISLQNPYGADFSRSFSHGRSFGLDVAIGKAFTPALTLRAKLNWENGLPLFGINHADMLAPFDKPGENMKKGGYVMGVGDVVVDFHNLFLPYKPDRMWHGYGFFRAGGLYNFGVSKGTPLLGLGIGSTFRINDKFKIYTDLAYNMVSSGHVGSVLETGEGSNSNGFFDFNVGLQINLGKNNTFKTVTPDDVKKAASVKPADDPLVTNGFMSNWYIQAGVDMSLQKPYKKPFSQVFPKGKSFGVDLAVGKWFTPEVSLRVRMNWENGLPIFRNKHLEWIATKDNTSDKYKGSYIAISLDVPVSVTNIFMGYNPMRRWDFNVFARAGLGMNTAIGSCSPMVGGGVECTYKLNDRWSLLAEYGFQTITSEFYRGIAYTGMEVATGFNSFMDIQLGVQFNLNRSPKNKFRRLSEYAN